MSEHESSQALILEGEAVSPEEAQAVLDLYHLKQRIKEEEHGYVLTSELADLLGEEPAEIESLLAELRRIQPSRLAVSQERVSQREAELLVARHAYRPQSQPPVLTRPLPQDRSLLQLARQRREEWRQLEGKSYAPTPPMQFGPVVGENPRSWAIVWTIVFAIAAVLTILILFFRH